MAYKADVKTTFEPSRIIQPIYTGGSVSLSQDGNILASTLGEEALLTDLRSGAHLARIEGDGEPLTTLALTPDASYLVLCSRSLSMRIYTLQPAELDGEFEARLARTLKPHTTPVVTLAIDSTSTLLATGGADGVIKVWDISGGFVTHTFHGHSGVISALHFFHVDAEEEQQQKALSKKSRKRNEEPQQVPAEATAGYRLASGGEDGKVRIWDLHKRKSITILDSHVSVVKAIDYSAEQKLLLSGSRDKTVILWDARSWQPASTLAVLETVETAGFLDRGHFIYTGGETARLRIWDTLNGNEITEDQEAGTEIESILDVQYHSTLPFLLTVHADQALILRSVESLQDLPTSQQIPPLPIIRRISGTHDEVIDLAYIGRKRDLMALATNLDDIRIISVDAGNSSTSHYFGADVAVLKGHDDIIITIDTDWSGHWLATGAKDNVAKLWRLDPENESYECYATFTGHAESISAVALSNAVPQVGSKEYDIPLDFPPKFLVTGSQDKTVKRWDVGKQGKASRAAYTRKAHDKDINAIETSHSSTAPIFASASQDRTVKIWDVETGETIGVLRGHKRGVWTVAFSPVSMPALTTTGEGGAASSAKGMVVTGSADKTVKIWSLADYSCLRTFEGHANSVLKVVWLPPPAKDDKARRGIQVASAAGDGLVKVWDAQSSECAATLDNHIDRVWALAVKPAPALTAAEQAAKHAGTNDDEDTSEEAASLELVSGSADSTLTFWHDTTATTAQRATTQATARIEQDQALQNHIHARNFREAIVLALQLNHPKRLLELFSSVVRGEHEEGSLTGQIAVDEVLGTLSESQLWSLLRRVRDWNANGRTHDVAQRVLYAILRLYPKEKLLALNRKRKAAPDADGALAEAMAELDVKDKGARKEGVKDVVDALKAYTERHYARLEKTSEERFVLLWALGQMDDVSGVQVQELTNRVNGVNGHVSEEEEDVLMLDGA